MPALDHSLKELERAVGAEHVLRDPDVTSGYVTDWTGRWCGETFAVVRPGNLDEVVSVVNICAEHNLPLVPQGGNTGLVGGSIPHNGELLLNLRRLNTIHAVDPIDRTITADAGVTLSQANAAAAEHGLTLGINTASRDNATLGGMVATNAGGSRVIQHGTIRSALRGVEAVLANGEVLRRWTSVSKDNVGYHLPGLLAGSEGTLAVITSVLLRLVPLSGDAQVLLLALPSHDAAAQALFRIQQSGLTVEAAEFFHQDGVDLVRQHANLPSPFTEPAPLYLLVEVATASQDTVVETLESLADLLIDGTLEPGPARRLWDYRELHTESVQAASSTPLVKLDTTIPVRKLDTFEGALRARIADTFPGVRVVTFGHFAEGTTHLNMLDVPPDEATNITDTALRLVSEFGGSISAEHGIGVSKKPWVHLGRTPTDISAMRAIKNAWDPQQLLNPGVLFPHEEE